MALDRAAIEAHLQTNRYARSLTVCLSTESTNDDAKIAAAAGAARGHVIVADRQTKGRGAHGRVWESPAGTDLYFSIIDRLEVAAHRLPALTLAVGLGVAESVEGMTRARALVKWPNDVWLNDRKCAGILVESTSTGTSLGPVVIGVGINVNRRAWNDELAPIATSLRDASGSQEYIREHVFCSLLQRIETRVDEFAAHGAAHIVNALQSRLALRGERVTVEGYGEGTLDGLMPDGTLRLVTVDGPRIAVAGTLRRAT